MTTITNFIHWLVPHAAHFLVAFVVSMGAIQITFGGTTFDLTSNQGRASALTALALAFLRAFEVQNTATPPTVPPATL